MGRRIGFLGLLGLIVAVAVAMTQLPDYEQLSKRSDLGQMVRVRASDGTLLVSLGPSFGRWLSYDEIPPTMRAAMIAVEDKRFRSHVGVDPIGVARRSRSGWKAAMAPGRLDHHPAAGAQHFPDQQPDLRPQDQGSGAGAGARAEVQQRTRSSSST
jgi:penicillin-binding protein 1A